MLMAQVTGDRYRRESRAVPVRSRCLTIISCSRPASRIPISDMTNGRPSAPGLKSIEDARLHSRTLPARLRARRNHRRRTRAPQAADLRDRRRRADRRRDGRLDRRGREPHTAIGFPPHRSARRRASCWSKPARASCRPCRRIFRSMRSARSNAWASRCCSRRAVTGCDARRRDTCTAAASMPRPSIWAAGVAASPAAQWIDAEHDRAGRIKVNRDLRIPATAATSSSSAISRRRKTRPDVRCPASRRRPSRWAVTSAS